MVASGEPDKGILVDPELRELSATLLALDIMGQAREHMDLSCIRWTRMVGY